MHEVSGTAAHGRALSGRSILIVEDEPLIALEVHAAFSAAGASIVAAGCSSEAMQMINSPGLSAAVVDIDLGRGEDCSAVCKRLSERSIPFVFFTGGARADILQNWPRAPVLTKLADKGRLVEVVAGLLC
jgi:CheY-like chemotaxis protein